MCRLKNRYLRQYSLQPIFIQANSQYYNIQNMTKNMFLVATVCVLMMIAESTVCPPYAQYVRTFDKQYSEQEYNRRQQIYEARCASWAELTGGYQPGVNDRTDQGDSENINGLLSNEAPGLRRVSSANIVSQVGQPSQLDWRDRNVITSIKNQGSCGSCWSFASAAYAESRLIIKKQSNISVDLSEQYVFKCTNGSTCSGGYLEYAMDTARNLPTEARYPYKPSEQSNGICSETDKMFVGDDRSSHYDLTDAQIITLLQQGPVAIAISSTGWINYGNGVYQCPSNAVVDHAVLLIGYTETYWIIKNQWGIYWGENGYMRLTRSRSNKANCQIGVASHILTGDSGMNSLIDNDDLDNSKTTDNNTTTDNSEANNGEINSKTKNNGNWQSKISLAALINLVGLMIIVIAMY